MSLYTTNSPFFDIFGCSTEYTTAFPSEIKSNLNKISASILVLLVSAFALSACDSDNNGTRSSGGRHHSEYEDFSPDSSRNLDPAPIPPGTVEAIDDHEVVQAQSAGQRDAEVSGLCVVRKLLRDDTVAPRHQRFLLELTNGSTVLVAHNTDLAPRVPIEEGDQLVIHGSFIYNPKGGVIHLTHHATSARHEGGYIDFKGLRYQ